MKKKKIKIKSSLAILIILIIVIAVLKIIANNLNIPSPKESEKLLIPDEIFGLSGKIENIQENTLVVKALILLKNSAKAPIEQSVKMIIDSNTKIVKLQFPNPKNISKGSAKPVFPKETMIKFSDLKVGNTIDVQTDKNISENIENGTEFTLTNIFLIEK